MTKYLIRPETGEVFIWTEILADRGDLQPYVPQPPTDNVDEPEDDGKPLAGPLPPLDDALATFKAEGVAVKTKVKK